MPAPGIVALLLGWIFPDLLFPDLLDSWLGGMFLGGPAGSPSVDEELSGIVLEGSA